MSSGLITTYLGQGLSADRPATPDIPAGAIAIYFATDGTSGAETQVYADGSWHNAVTLAGALVAANNLSEVASPAVALANLGGKSKTPSIQSVASAATVTPTFSDDQVNITAQAAGLTLANPTGTAVDGWAIAIQIKDNGTARSITFGSQYRPIGVTLPTTTVIGKTLYLGMVFNNADTKWDVVAVAQEA